MKRMLFQNNHLSGLKPHQYFASRYFIFIFSQNNLIKSSSKCFRGSEIPRINFIGIENPDGPDVVTKKWSSLVSQMKPGLSISMVPNTFILPLHRYRFCCREGIASNNTLSIRLNFSLQFLTSDFFCETPLYF